VVADGLQAAAVVAVVWRVSSVVSTSRCRRLDAALERRWPSSPPIRGAQGQRGLRAKDAWMTVATTGR
jgi:hypothetical protein